MRRSADLRTSKALMTLGAERPCRIRASHPLSHGTPTTHGTRVCNGFMSYWVSNVAISSIVGTEFKR